MDELIPGSLIAGRFEVEGPALGAGATGVVLPARDVASGDEVALKVLHDELSADAGALAALEAEAGAAGELQHPHIVAVRGLWAHGARHVLVTDRVHGPALSEVDSALAPEAVVALGRQVAGALREAHAAGLVHGDVRPGNVLVGPSGAALFDFGIARSARAAGASAAVVRPGVTAPEVLDGAPPTRASDLYGLGMVLARAAGGKHPWAEVPPLSRVALQRAGELPELGVPHGLKVLISALLHPDPEARPRSIGQVCKALDRLAHAPERTPRLGRPWMAPLGVGANWIVHGVDPATGAEARVRSGLSRGRAARLARHLREQGWDVRADREALGLSDLWLALGLGALAAYAIPVVGGPLGVVGALAWRSAGCRPALRQVLPPVEAPLPPRIQAAGAEYAVGAGLLLLLTALLLWLSPPLALVPAALVALLAVGALRVEAASPHDDARAGRIDGALAAARRALDRAPTDDRALACAAELDQLEAEWRSGGLPPAQVLRRAEELRGAAVQQVRDLDPLASAAVEALRRSRAELSSSDPTGGTP